MKQFITTNCTIDEFKGLIYEELKRVLEDKKALQKKEPRLLTSEEVQELFHISKPTLLKYRNEGKIPFTKISRKVFFREDKIYEALEKLKS